MQSAACPRSIITTLPLLYTAIHLSNDHVRLSTRLPPLSIFHFFGKGGPGNEATWNVQCHVKKQQPVMCVCVWGGGVGGGGGGISRGGYQSLISECSLRRSFCQSGAHQRNIYILCGYLSSSKEIYSHGAPSEWFSATAREKPAMVGVGVWLLYSCVL